jgi:hypothetical protein
MLNFIRNHPYLVSFIIVFLLVFLLGVFALDFSWSESLFGAAVIAAVGVGGYWWKDEGLG